MHHRRHDSVAAPANAPECPHCGSGFSGVLAVGWSVVDGDVDLCAVCGVERGAPNAVCQVPPGLEREAGLHCPLRVGYGANEEGGASLSLPDFRASRDHPSEGGQAGVVAARHDEDGGCPVCGRISGEVLLEGIVRALSEGRKDSR